MVAVKDKAGSFLMHLEAHSSHGYLSVALWAHHVPSSFTAQHRPCWGAEWGAGEHKPGAGMSVEPWVCISYLYSCGKSVLLDGYSVPLRVKIEI